MHPHDGWWALTVRQPWATWLATPNLKDIENRNWPTRRRGRFLIHAGLGMTNDEYDFAVDWLAMTHPNMTAPAKAALPRGAIIGVADLVDCVTASDSAWFSGPHGFAVANVRPLSPIPVKGAQRFWRVTDSAVLQAVNAALGNQVKGVV